MTVVKFDMLSKVAPDLLTKKGIIVYPNMLITTNPTKYSTTLYVSPFLMFSNYSYSLNHRNDSRSVINVPNKPRKPR